MGYVLNLGFCEVCGEKIPPGEKYCKKHRNHKDDMFDKENSEEDTEHDY